MKFANLFSVLNTLILFWSIQGFAYFSHHATGNLITQRDFNLTATIQQITNPDSATNVVGYIDSGFSDSANIRAIIGVGKKDFQLGGMYKWVPVPDYENQPAMGLMYGALYVSDDDSSELNLRLHPFVSKNFETTLGQFNAYAALPMGIRKFDGDSDFPIQFVVGAELEKSNHPNIGFTAEVGMDFHKAFTYFSVGLLYKFSEAGPKF